MREAVSFQGRIIFPKHEYSPVSDKSHKQILENNIKNMTSNLTTMKAIGIIRQSNENNNKHIKSNWTDGEKSEIWPLS